MYTRFFDRLVVATGTDALSPAVPTAGSNAARSQVILISHVSLTGLTATMQGSNDLQNWRDLSTTGSLTAIGGTSFANTAITDAYLRMKISITGTNAIGIVMADGNLSQQ
ncbi:MAG: hypothetical protein HYY18_20315 [Planctomycetes bacterium]|nr:hypothetical protein [Planctomycetota bacterium]